MMTAVMEFIPIKSFLLWLPQVMRLAEIELRENLSPHMYKIIEKLAIYYPQGMYFCIKPFFKSTEYKSVRDVFLNMKKIYYNLMTKM